MSSKAKRTTPLTKEEIFERALALADREGLEALTMRRLAAEVGVEAASLYHHVPNKSALLDGVVSLARSGMKPPETMPEDWRDLMLDIFTEYRRVLAAHPNLLPLAGRRVESDPDSGLTYLVAIGVDPDDAVGLWQSVIAFVVGFASFGSARTASDTFDLNADLAARMSDWREETFQRTLRTIIGEYGSVREAAAGGGDQKSEETIQWPSASQTKTKRPDAR